MNDYWNDPPDGPEWPECCDQEMEIDEAGNCACKVCGSRIDAPVEPELEPDLPDPDIQPPEPDPICPHGNERHECDHCAYLSDLAYDAARESR